MPLNENQLLARLGELIDPNTRKPYAAARAIKSVSAQDDALEIVVELGYPPPASTPPSPARLRPPPVPKPVSVVPGQSSAPASLRTACKPTSPCCRG